jgi:hypothetical protein
VGNLLWLLVGVLVGRWARDDDFEERLSELEAEADALRNGDGVTPKSTHDATRKRS